HFVSAVGRRQQSLVKASLPKLLNSFVRHTAVRFTSRRPVSKIGNQGMSARNEIFVSWDCDESVRNAHGLCPVFPRSLPESAHRTLSLPPGKLVGPWAVF